MILILGRSDDASTRDVAIWLTSLGKNFVVFHSNENINNVRFHYFDSSQKRILFSIDSKEIDLGNINSVWNRRNGLFIMHLGINKNKHNLLSKENNVNYINSLLKEEEEFLLNYIRFFLKKNGKRELGSFKHNVVNKLEVLSMASECGLLTPATYVLTDKKKLLEILEQNSNKRYITKPIGQGGIYRFTKKENYYTYVEELTENFLKKIPNYFYPSLFQEKIEKKYELRVFYLDEIFYSMVIFSQKNKFTKVDFRKPAIKSSEPVLRMIPYQLPFQIENKLRHLLKKMKLNTASIDIIIDNLDNYYFLEINPVGQFAMTSYPCNYYLEKKIALSL